MDSNISWSDARRICRASVARHRAAKALAALEDGAFEDAAPAGDGAPDRTGWTLVASGAVGTAIGLGIAAAIMLAKG